MGEPISNIDVLILCGGQGSRIADHVPPDTPKCMIDINGQPFIDLLLNNLVMAGFQRFILLTGYLADKIKPSRFSVLRNHSEEQLGTGGAVAKALKEESLSDTFMVVNGDTFCKLDYEYLLKVHAAGGAFGTVPYDIQYRNLGSFVFNRSLWEKLSYMPAKYDTEYVLAECAKRSIPIKWLCFGVQFYDIGTPEGLQKLRSK